MIKHRKLFAFLLVWSFMVAGAAIFGATRKIAHGTQAAARDVVDTSAWTPDVVVIHEAQRTEFEATGYAIGPPYSTITKAGHPVFNKGSISVGGMDVFTIAVDPHIIPLGSIVYIDSLGVALATDTGTKIKGMIIDVCFSDMGEAMKWGRRKVQVTMLRRGNG